MFVRFLTGAALFAGAGSRTAIQREVFMRLLISGCVAAALLLAPVVAVSHGAERMTVDDEVYLRRLAGDTWACIARFVEPVTGLPYDTSERSEFTSVTNLGYYVAACGVAAKMKLCTEAEATARVRRAFSAYEKFRTWNGFSQSWNSVRTLEPAAHDPMISLLDTANMVAGFVVAGQALPEMRAQSEAILARMDWAAVYDEERGLLFGGYDMAKGKLDSGWRIGDYAGDGRMAAFWAIAVGAAPPESWENLKRETAEHYGMTIFRPGWLGGGLFMQTQDGLFLDERATPIGQSAADFAYAQMLYAKQLDLPVWGWSACAAPDGRYLGWGGLEVPVVTPHAVGMAAMVYPRRAVACFRKLEELDVRKPYRERGKTYAFGFRDSIDLKTGLVSDVYLTGLDQTMLLFGLANAVEDRLVQRLFESHPTVRRGRELIPEYREEVPAERLAEWRRRDYEPLRLPKEKLSRGPAKVLVDDFADADVAANLAGGTNSTWTRDGTDESVSVGMARDELAGGCLRIDYDVESANPAYGGVTFSLSGVDVSGCDALTFRVRGAAQTVKLELHGKGGSGAVRFSGSGGDKWRSVRTRLTDFGGMITDWRKMDRLVIVFEDNASAPQRGTLWIDDIRFVGD